MRTITKVAVLAALFTGLFQTAAAQSADDIADRYYLAAVGGRAALGKAQVAAYRVTNTESTSGAPNRLRRIRTSMPTNCSTPTFSLKTRTRCTPNLPLVVPSSRGVC